MRSRTIPWHSTSANREAQSNMLTLFEKRDVIPEVIETVKERVKHLK